MSLPFASDGQSIGVSASASVLPMNTNNRSLGWTGWISLQSKGLSRVFSKHHSSKASILRRSAFIIVQLSHPDMTTEKTIAFTRPTFVGKVMSVLFNMIGWLERQWQPTPVLFPGESQGWRSLVGCCLWGHTELDTTEAT